MRSQSQTAMIALATLFTMALALAVAFICISNLREDAPAEQAPLPSESTLLPITTEPPLPITTTSPEEESPLPSSQGLRFTSNGDGTCVLTGIGTCMDSCVVIPSFSPTGERVTAIAPMAFYAVSTVTALQIPSSVMDIGALAFADCPNLVYVSVADDNAFYCDLDGVLYTADESTLILYPAQRSGSTVTVSGATRRICDMAFYKCAYLTRISYAGSAEQWESIRIGTKNYSLTAAAKEFNSMA